MLNTARMVYLAIEISQKKPVIWLLPVRTANIRSTDPIIEYWLTSPNPGGAGRKPSVE
jgi:hypothetical protein